MKAEAERRRLEELRACLHELVERQADRTPDATALIAGVLALSYRDLDESANGAQGALLQAINCPVA